MAALTSVGCTLQGVLLVNALLWAAVAQIVVSIFLPALGASGAVRLAVGLLLAVNTVTMGLVPQLMSEPLFTLAVTSAVCLVMVGNQSRGAILALALLTFLAAATRNVGGVYAIAALAAAVVSRRWRLALAFGAGWAAASILLNVERASAPLPVGDALEVVRYYVSYDVHEAFFGDRFSESGWRGLLAGLRIVVSANGALGPGTLGQYFAPAAYVGGESPQPGAGTTLLGLDVLSFAGWEAARSPRARLAGMLVVVHVAIFLVWTWPFAGRFWLPVLPLLVSLALLRLASLGAVGRLLIPVLAAFALVGNGIRPFYSLVGRVQGDQDTTNVEEDVRFNLGVQALRERAQAGDVLVGGSYVFWLARDFGTSAVEARALVPFDGALLDVLQVRTPDEDSARLSALFAGNLRRLRKVSPRGGTVWVVIESDRRDAKRTGIASAAQTGLLRNVETVGAFTLFRVATEDEYP